MSLEVDDFELSSLLGMSTLLNREQVDTGTNAKVVEREMLQPVVQEDEVEEEEDPVDMYNQMISSLETDQEVETTWEKPATWEQPTTWNSWESKEDFSTMEQSNQTVVDTMIPNVKDSRYDMLDENVSDMKLTLLEKIDNLREELEDDGVNLDKVPRVDFSSSLADIEYVAKLLMLKANRNRYSNMGEEFILAFSSVLETLFNGKREFFGRRPDLTNVSDIVKVKLRRVKGETSQIVSSVVEKYEISPLATVLIELVPSIFLHSRRRSSQKYSLESDIEEIRHY